MSDFTNNIVGGCMSYPWDKRPEMKTSWKDNILWHVSPEMKRRPPMKTPWNNTSYVLSEQMREPFKFAQSSRTNEGYSGFFDSMWRGIKNAGGWFKDKLIKPIGKGIRTGVDLLTPVLEKVSPGIANILKSVGSVAGGIGDWAENPSTEGAQNILTSALNNKDTLKSMGNRDTWQNASNEIQTNYKNARTMIQNDPLDVAQQVLDQVKPKKSHLKLPSTTRKRGRPPLDI